MHRSFLKNVFDGIRSRSPKSYERCIHGIFLILGFFTVGCVLLITVYLILSGLPAILEIGLIEFMFGSEWASTAAEPKFGILPFILTSIYGTAGAILLGVPIGFFCAVYLSKVFRHRPDNRSRHPVMGTDDQTPAGCLLFPSKRLCFLLC